LEAVAVLFLLINSLPTHIQLTRFPLARYQVRKVLSLRNC